jgi:hypothetical protein
MSHGALKLSRVPVQAVVFDAANAPSTLTNISSFCES